MLSFTSTASTRLLRTSCLRLAHHRYQTPFVAARFFPRTARRDAHDHNKDRNSFERPGRVQDELAGKAHLAFARTRETKPDTRLPSFREELLKEDPTIGQDKFENKVERPGIWKQVTFVALASTTLFLYAAEATTYDTIKWASKFPDSPFVTSEHIRRAKITDLAESLKKKLQRMRDAASDLPNALTYPFLWAYVQLANGYINSSEGKQITYQICAINGVVWVMWQISRLRPFMRANFTHHPLSGRSITLLYSMFSHQSFLHFLFNSLALTGFGSAAAAYLVNRQAEDKQHIRESTPKYHFWAVFVSAGLFSALLSHVVAARITFPRILSQLSTSAAKTVSVSATTAFRRAGSAVKEKTKDLDILPSLGASGAIYALVTISALAYPDAQIFLLFLPGVPVPIVWGVGGMIAIDILGIIRGWRFFDHWAHLGGAAFGALYYKYGPDFWNKLRLSSLESVKSHFDKVRTYEK